MNNVEHMVVVEMINTNVRSCCDCTDKLTVPLYGLRCYMNFANMYIIMYECYEFAFDNIDNTPIQYCKKLKLFNIKLIDLYEYLEC